MLRFEATKKDLVRRSLSFVFLGCCCLLPISGDNFQTASPDSLSSLVDHSDLIIIATPMSEPDGCMSEGPMPNGVTPTPIYERFISKVRIDQVIKGDLQLGQRLLISLTVLVYGPKDRGEALTAKNQQDFLFDLKKVKVDPEVAFPHAPHKDVSYIFFLQDRRRHDPPSYEAVGREEVFYRTFDFTTGIVPIQSGLVEQVHALAGKK